MNEPSVKFPSGRLQSLLLETARRRSALHGQFLQQRRKGIADMQALIALQIRGAGAPAARPARFTADQLDEFGTGVVSRCFGPDFACYDQRRIPRIPNGALKMMSRIVDITGTRGNFQQPASVVAEYDVPPDAWYLHDSASAGIPYSLYMEIALQPCGFLSAYLDTYALVPYGQFYFRNLDGQARLLVEPDVRGQTITTSARLLSSTASAGTVIQKFAFALSCQGQTIYKGESTFGYFAAETMANQVGLDGGRQVLPWLRSPEAAALPPIRLDMQRWRAALPGKPALRLPVGQLAFLPEVQAVPAGGTYRQGYVYARRAVNPQDWFYPFHFYQDPVMPGSLGVEAVLEALQGYALAFDLGGGLRSPSFGQAAASLPVTWRYRGQVTQQHKFMELEAHIQKVERTGREVTITADANVWVDGLRIYELKNATVAIRER